jgi:hypothetical protein
VKFTRERKYTVNMGNYESLTFGGSVELDTDSVVYEHEKEDAIDAASRLADDLLDQIMAAEIKEARELTNTKDSFILSYRN